MCSIIFQEVPSLPRHSTRRSTPLQRIKVEQITGHQSARQRGGIIAVLYKTHWVGLSEPSWEREMYLHLSRPAPTFRVIGLALRTSTAKPTASTAECGSGRHNASSPATTRNVFSLAGLRLCSPRRVAPSLPRHGAC